MPWPLGSHWPQEGRESTEPSSSGLVWQILMAELPVLGLNFPTQRLSAICQLMDHSTLRESAVSLKKNCDKLTWRCKNKHVLNGLCPRTPLHGCISFPFCASCNSVNQLQICKMGCWWDLPARVLCGGKMRSLMWPACSKWMLKKCWLLSLLLIQRCLRLNDSWRKDASSLMEAAFCCLLYRWSPYVSVLIRLT